MNCFNPLSVLEQAGLSVSLLEDGQTLKITPATQIDATLKTFIREHKPTLIQQLNCTAHTLPLELLERVDWICQLEQWPAGDRAEWLMILQRQLIREEVNTAELVACLDAHLVRHHQDRVSIKTGEMVDAVSESPKKR
ncbi:hypothetical protein HZU77_008805 [Neisseriaceae bacterium TC5R-5]|nr:hypothetical protein [Neisseriaceae bacterium TC5R-5]